MTAGQLCLEPWPGEATDMYRIGSYVMNPEDETLIRRSRPKPVHMVCVLPKGHDGPWHEAGYDTTRWDPDQPKPVVLSRVEAMAAAFAASTT